MEIRVVKAHKYQKITGTSYGAVNIMNVLEQLRTQPFAYVPFTIDPYHIRNAMHGFREFLKEPESVKKHIDLTIAPEHRRGDIGYKRRRLNERCFNDSKEFFHFHPALFEFYEPFLQQNPKVLDFIYCASIIWGKVHDTMHQVLSSLETHFTGIVGKVFATQNPHIILRFVRYDWQKSEKYLAKPHYDAGSCTLAISESSLGLRIGTCPEDLQLIEHQEQKAVLMLGANYKKLMNSKELAAGWHDVIQVDETQIGQSYGRWSLVAFIDAHGVETVSREQTHHLMMCA